MTTLREQSRAAWITLAILLSGAGYLCFLVLRPFIEPLTYGIIAAVLAYPLHRRIATRLGHPSVAALLTSVIVVVMFVAPMAFLISIVVNELRDGYVALGQPAAAEGANRLWQVLEGPFNRVAGWLGTDSASLRQSIAERVGAGSSALIRQVFAVAGATAGGILRAIVALMALYFALRDGHAIYKQVLAHSPLGPSRTARIGEAAHGMMVASFYGVVAVASAQGILCGLGAWIAGLPSPALWGFATAVCSVIPLVGSALVWLPAAVVLFAQGSIGYGIFMLVWGGVVISNIDNFVRPWVLTAQVSMNGLVVLIALLGGVQAFGLIGIFMGPVILAVTVESFGILREEIGHAEGTG